MLSLECLTRITVSMTIVILIAANFKGSQRQFRFIEKHSFKNGKFFQRFTWSKMYVNMEVLTIILVPLLLGVKPYFY